MRRKILLGAISSQSRNDTLVGISVLNNLIESITEAILEDMVCLYSGSTDIYVSSSDDEVYVPLLVHKRKGLPTGLRIHCNGHRFDDVIVGFLTINRQPLTFKGSTLHGTVLVSGVNLPKTCTNLLV